jgi:uncharacterized protein
MAVPEQQAVAIQPFDPRDEVGIVFEVDPSSVKLNLEGGAASEGGGRCEVGEFVVLDCGSAAVLGRLLRIQLPESDRLGADKHEGSMSPIGTVQLLTTIRLETRDVAAGVEVYPPIGARAYAADTSLIRALAEASSDSNGTRPVVLDIATLADGTPTGLAPEKLFGRHCAVLGTTGGGKSWTLARLIEAAAEFRSKVILLDPTGEYYTLDSAARHVSLGGSDRPDHAIEATFPYQDLLEDDLIALFRPDTRVQLAKMRAAIKSLKLAAIVGYSSSLVAGNGCIPKAGQPKAPFDAEYHEHIAEIENPEATFDVSLLPTQIRLECVWPAEGLTPGERARWGEPRVDELSECDTLMARIEQHLSAPEYSCIFGTDGLRSFGSVVRDFLDSDDQVLRVSLRQLAFTGSTREIVVNAIGRHLLQLGRAGEFNERPLVVLIDEAHQFLNKAVGEPWWSHTLDSFELIAKEGRKYALTACLATQRPRDLPEGVLSQMGTFIVHRLVDDADREIVERASGEVDREAAKFLPSLGPGQAVVIGAELPMPFTLHFRAPEHPPDSRGPDYQAFWR